MIASSIPCIFAGDYEASRPPTVQKCSDSRRPRGQQTLLSINLGISGGLFCDLFSLLSSLFSLLSSLFSLLSSLAAARPGKVQTLLQYSCPLFLQGSSRFSLRSSLVSPRARPFSLPSRPSGTEPSLFSLLSSLFPLLSLLLFSQIPLRDCHFDLCIRPLTARRTASTLCGSYANPGKCKPCCSTVAVQLFIISTRV